MAAPATVITRPAERQSNAEEFDAVASRAQASFGFVNFTVLAWSDARSSLTRIYSTSEQEFPVGGEKFMPQDAEWPTTVIGRQSPHSCWTVRDIEMTYNDSEVIKAMGGTSLLCVPVVSAGATLGALNFIGKQEKYSEETLKAMLELAKGAVPAFETWGARAKP